MAISDNNAGGFGGGIENSGMLTMTNCVVTLNVSGAEGGGIDNFEGSVTLNDCSVMENTAADNGGGIANFAEDVTINGGSISGNTAGGLGGAIFNQRLLTLNGVTVDMLNTALMGGGIHNEETGSVDLNSSSVSGNRATVITPPPNGGGIRNFGEVDCDDANTVNNNDPDNCVDVGTGSGCDTCQS